MTTLNELIEVWADTDSQLDSDLKAKAAEAYIDALEISVKEQNNIALSALTHMDRYCRQQEGAVVNLRAELKSTRTVFDTANPWKKKI